MATMRPTVHSRCVQVREHDVARNAMSIFSARSRDGEIPLVLIPAPRHPWSLWFQVPSGVDCLLQKFGKHEPGIAVPGLHLGKPFWWRVAYCVTKQSCTYDAPVARAPTKDDVAVNIDVVLVFKIIDSAKFVYKLGAKNFDELLTGVVDEGIRRLVRQETHESVYSLRGDRAHILLEDINSRFEANCGVKFMDVKVTSVWLPPELAQTLETTTKMEKQMERIKRQYEFESLQIKFGSDMAIEAIKRNSEQVIVAQNGNRRRAELEYEQKSVKVEEDGRVRLIEAEATTQVMLKEIEAELKRKQVNLETYKVTELASAEAAASSRKIKADEQAEIKIIEASWQEEEMKSQAKCQKFEAIAEVEASKCLQAKRRHELLLREKQILAKLASTGNFNLVGAAGDRIVSAMMAGTLKK